MESNEKFKENSGRNERDIKNGKKGMDLRAVPDLCWLVSGLRSVWEIYADFHIWYQIGVE